MNRKETDAFGTVDIPTKALFGINTVRAVENLSFSNRHLGQYPTYIRALAYVKKAAALANLEAGVLDAKRTSAIIVSCEKLIDGFDSEQFPVDILHGGGGIGTNMNINEVIANLANELLGEMIGSYRYIHPTDHVNASQSTSDACHTAIRIGIVLSFKSLNETITKLIETVKVKANELMTVSTISRTCLQDGMKIQLGDTFSGYASMLERRLNSLVASIHNLYQINLGGTVVGSGAGAPEAYRNVVLEKLREVTGLLLIHRPNLYDAAQNIDDLAQVSNELRLLATCLIKMAKDLRLLSSGPEAGFQEISLPAVQAGSSFFPGKINPVVPETLIQCCFQVLGCDYVVQCTLEHGELDLNIFEGAAGSNILDAMQMLEKALGVFTEKCMKGIQADKKRNEELANSFIPTVVALKEKYGYSTVSKLVKEMDKDEIKAFYKNGGYGSDRES